MSNEDEDPEPYFASDFLVESSLFVPEDIYDPSGKDFYSIEPIRIYCGHCEGIRTFTPKWGEVSDYGGYPHACGIRDFLSLSHGRLSAFAPCFSCANCRSQQIFYFLTSFDTSSTTLTAVKIGEFPPVYDPVSSALKRVLKKKNRLDLFRKGQHSEKHNYGIGAHAYYRRLVELTIDDLLNHVAKLIPEGKKSEFDEVLKKAKAETRAKDKIEVIKDQLPPELRPGGSNPLQALHSCLSEGIHDLSDQECLAEAQDIRDALESFLILLDTALEHQKKLSEGTQRVLERRARRGKGKS